VLLRGYIRAPEGRVFVIADYSQIELRNAAKISGDQEMLSAYAEGRDLHTLTARSLTGREEVSKDDRKLAKVVNYNKHKPPTIPPNPVGRSPNESAVDLTLRNARRLDNNRWLPRGRHSTQDRAPRTHSTIASPHP